VQVKDQLLDLLPLASRHPGGALFTIIVGKGLHSQGNVANIRNAVTRYLQNQQPVRDRSGKILQFRWELQPGNDGCIDVHIPNAELE
jgi:hypothetical protein